VSPTGDYLDRIVPAVLRRLEERRDRLPLDELRAVESVGPRPSFAAAIASPGVSLISEVKRASPSKGPIRPDLEVATLVADYEAGGAQAISVLTEGDFFLGGLADLRLAAATTTLPLLRKDFIVDEYQLYEAQRFGASAVLLIAALLDDSRLLELMQMVDSLGLDVLLEVHDEPQRMSGVWPPRVSTRCWWGRVFLFKGTYRRPYERFSVQKSPAPAPRSREPRRAGR
jgi:indole-3-glycerol phosphate synthase